MRARPALAVAMLLLPLPACAAGTAPAGAGTARGAIERDVEGYAVASCLASLDDASLKDGGRRWAGAIVQRGHGEIERFTAVSDAVKAERAATPMAMGHDDDRPMAAVPLPLLYCGEIIDAPRVRTAIDAAIAALRPAYAEAVKP